MNPQKVHYTLGYLGLIPFIGLAALQAVGAVESSFYLLSYAALILSFLGGTLWTSSIAMSQGWTVAVVSNGAMLLAWAALIMRENPVVLIAVALLLIGVLIFERVQLGDIYHRNLLKLRLVLTLGAAFSLLLAAAFSVPAN
jgi:hypothetical protein